MERYRDIPFDKLNRAYDDIVKDNVTDIYSSLLKDYNIDIANMPTLSVYELDLITMLLQYRSWSKVRLSQGLSTDSNIFIAMIVLPNTLDSILDYSLYNRFMAIANGEKIPENLNW